MFVVATIVFAVGDNVYVLCHEGAISLNGLITFRLKFKTYDWYCGRELFVL